MSDRCKIEIITQRMLKLKCFTLSDVCRKHDVIVLADEIYARIKYSQDHVSMAKVTTESYIR